MHTRSLSAVLLAAVGLTLAARPARAEQVDLSMISSNGSPEPVRTGFYAETELGTFFTLGGADQYSNVEAFLGLGAGYEFNVAPWLSMGVGLQFQLAPSSGDCYEQTDSGCAAAPGGPPPQGTSTFTMAALDAEVSFRFRVANRLFVPVRVFGGMADFTPLPRCDLASGACPNASGTVPPSAPGDVWEPSLGGAVGVEYATHFDHFTIGLEASGRFVWAMNMTALAIYPRVKYTF
ncbi:MAG: adventurous gliding motility protein CglE [Myxococcales bacterium]